jgi:hypothetical protein
VISLVSHVVDGLSTAVTAIGRFVTDELLTQCDDQLAPTARDDRPMYRMRHKS